MVKQHQALWNSAKKLFIRAGKAQKGLKSKARERIEHLGEKSKVK